MRAMSDECLIAGCKPGWNLRQLPLLTSLLGWHLNGVWNLIESGMKSTICSRTSDIRPFSEVVMNCLSSLSRGSILTQIFHSLGQAVMILGHCCGHDAGHFFKNMQDLCNIFGHCNYRDLVFNNVIPTVLPKCRTLHIFYQNLLLQRKHVKCHAEFGTKLAHIHHVWCGL